MNREDRLPLLIDEKNLPTKHVARFIERFAAACQVTAVRTHGDVWAESVTRLAGDEVRTDETERTIIALKKAGKLSQRSMVLLLVNHLREAKGV
jgi:hypothetical protein